MEIRKKIVHEVLNPCCAPMAMSLRNGWLTAEVGADGRWAIMVPDTSFTFCYCPYCGSGSVQTATMGQGT